MKIQIPLGLLQRGVIGRFSLGSVDTIPDGFFVGAKTIQDSSGGSRGGARGGGPLFLDQTEARREKKNVFEAPPPHPLSQDLDPPLDRASVHTFRGDFCDEAKLRYTDL